MNSIVRSYLIPTLAIIVFIWVFSRPLASIGLFVYDFTGANLSSLFSNIERTKDDASDLLAAKAHVKELKTVNVELTMENMKLKARAAKLHTLERQLAFKNDFAYNTIAAQIIGRSPDTWHKQIIIDKGEADGIKIGKGVLTAQGIIGQVIKTTNSNSIAQLVFSPNFKMGVKVGSINRYGVLSGNYPGPGHVEFIPVDANIQVGDKVVTSGVCLKHDACSYPADFPVGTVVEVTRDPDVVDLLVKVKFDEELTGIKEVFVLQ